jgi:hypothetical protein
LHRRDVFVARSGRFTDPRANLLSGSAWTAARPEICAGLSLPPEPERALDQLGAQLDGAYRQTAERLETNLALDIAKIAGTDRPDLSKLQALDEPEQLTALRSITAAMLPDRVAFSEVLLEVCTWTDHADAFTHLSEGRARAEDCVSASGDNGRQCRPGPQSAAPQLPRAGHRHAGRGPDDGRGMLQSGRAGCNR